MGNFKKGLLVGGAVGAFLTWLNFTPKGKEVRSQIMSHLEPLFNELKSSIKQLEGPTEEMYDALVERAVEEYGDKWKLAVEVKNSLIHQLKKRWKELEKDLKK
ncbi:MAG: YtxH domain-containing protein [Candidatus Magasanikbacteria bacterium]|nr:YtxH domain-containing protein [Candidatus Magasanikbacteria bacterium]